jgi:hypothetical protein
MPIPLLLTLNFLFVFVFYLSESQTCAFLVCFQFWRLERSRSKLESTPEPGRLTGLELSRKEEDRGRVTKTDFFVFVLANVATQASGSLLLF